MVGIIGLFIEALRKCRNVASGVEDDYDLFRLSAFQVVYTIFFTFKCVASSKNHRNKNSFLNENKILQYKFKKKTLKRRRT